ncbi:hypothetical protein IU427_15065 [Nocardia beijingensis]|nr:hypothetical protein [Nocardia beijingensis]MBF6466490.1 hypothetical protein [Nocardia beijingensis]
MLFIVAVADGRCRVEHRCLVRPVRVLAEQRVEVTDRGGPQRLGEVVGG